MYGSSYFSWLEYYSANEEAMGSNPVEVPKILVTLQLLKLQIPLRRSYLHINSFILSYSLFFRFVAHSA